MLDVIGDIHGHAEQAKQLLKKLGYRETNGAFRHPDRMVVFLGDLIDRGPEQLETVNLVRRMVDAGSAKCIMGNHEYNAVAYMTQDPESPREFLRKHTKNNRTQHAAFLDQIGEGSALHHELVSWFKTLPVAFENDGLRAIHACWSDQLFHDLEGLLGPGRTILEHAWVPMSRKKSKAYHAIESLLKGTEIELPEGLSYHDNYGHERKKSRTRWWDSQATKYRDFLLVPSDLIPMLPDAEVGHQHLATFDKTRPILVGHYWMSGTPDILNEHVACLDYSIGKGSPTSKLCAYRWDGEDRLSREKLIWVSGPNPELRKIFEASIDMD